MLISLVVGVALGTALGWKIVEVALDAGWVGKGQACAGWQRPETVEGTLKVEEFRQSLNEVVGYWRSFFAVAGIAGTSPWCI